MNRNVFLIGTALVLCLLLAYCSRASEPVVDLSATTRIVKTLSADEMRGRYALDPEIRKAADFIAGEFKKAGLRPIPGEKDFKQRFGIVSIATDSSSVMLNGMQMEDNSYFALPDSESFMIREQSPDPVIRIDAEQDFRDTFNRYRRDDKSSVVFVHENHTDIFNRYRSYFSRPSRKFKSGEGKDDVFILYSGEVDQYEISFSNSISTHELYNVAGYIPGKTDDEQVVFGAHYDHIGITRAVESDSIGNGANDNASGVTGVIQLANFFAESPKPERSLYFVAFTAEELGGMGSEYFTESVNPEQVVAMFNIEMIGKAPLDGPNSAWITGFDLSDFGEILQEYSADDTSFTFIPDPYTNFNLFYRSDNANLARKGIPAHTISTTPLSADNDYHTATDEFGTLDLQHLNNTIRAIGHAARGIVSGEATPRRIDVTRLERR